MAHTSNRHAGEPALLSGTSSEYLGRRPPPRILRERAVVLLMGEAGVGKSRVAARLAETLGPLPGRGRLVAGLHTLDAAALQEDIVAYVANRRWSEVVRNSGVLVLDGPVWLHVRPAQLQCLVALFKERAERGRRTFVCQGPDEASLPALMKVMEPGSLVTIALRFPKGSQGRLRFARRECEVLKLPPSHARDTDLLEPWGYDRVIQSLRAQSEAQRDPQRGKAAQAAQRQVTASEAR